MAEQKYLHHDMVALRLRVIGWTMKDACDRCVMPGANTGLLHQNLYQSKQLVTAPSGVSDLVIPTGHSATHLGKFVWMAVALGLEPVVTDQMREDVKRAFGEGKLCADLLDAYRRYYAVSVLFEPPDARVLSNYNFHPTAPDRFHLLGRHPTPKERLRVRLEYLERFCGYSKDDIADRLHGDDRGKQRMLQYISTDSGTNYELMDEYSDALMIDPSVIMSDVPGYPIALIEVPKKRAK